MSVEVIVLSNAVKKIDPSFMEDFFVHGNETNQFR